MSNYLQSGRTFSMLFLTSLALGACGGGSSSDSENNNEDTQPVNEAVNPVNTPQDEELRELIAENNLTGDPSTGRNLPSINDPLPQLGKLLFFSKSLGGDFDSACVSCHHPMLGGADDLPLSVGVDAVNEDLLGAGRVSNGGVPLVPRNAPTIFNVGLWDTGLFWDSRVESLGKETGENGAASGIRTPDSALGIADPNAGGNLVAAQARFPVTSSEEMKTEDFENGSDNQTIRHHLAARLGDYGIGEDELAVSLWTNEFQAAFNSAESPENLVTFDNIALAIGEYERSMVFINSPWKAYVDGDNSALTEDEKAGALLFFSRPNEGGAGCSGCHSGDLFSDGSHQAIAFPQIGPGKGDGNNDDFGRERETGNQADRYRFRVPSLLNIATSAPYGHAGAYATLEEVIDHYDNPRRTVTDFFDDGGWCQLNQFEDINNCATLYPDAENNSELALDKLQMERNNDTSRLPNVNLNQAERAQLVAFLRTLTDPCVEDRECLSPWVPDNTDTGPDGQQLNAVDQFSQPL